MQTTALHPDYEISTVRDALRQAECAALVQRAERIGFTDAPITTPIGFVMMPEVRNNTRVMVDEPKLAADLWERLAPVVPSRLGAWSAVGLNERLRFYRYEPGQRFAWHYDGAFVRALEERSRLLEERSQLTLMLYLNGDFEGGATEFDVDPALSVRPERGMALLFAHRVRHQGAAVTRGVKYVLRTDVMFRRAE
jgi:predicted 2-oxoglutarate/Fe(II)-dependent dioxygenase YbiX